MKMLYDSDSFVVVHMLPDAGLSDSVAKTALLLF